MDQFSVVREVLLPFVLGLASSAAVVALGVRSLKDYLRTAERRRQIGDLEHFWAGPGKSKTFNVVFGADWKGREGEIEPRFGYAQAYGVSELISCFELVSAGRASVNLAWVRLSDNIDQRLFNDNIIILGGQLSIELFGRFSRAINVPYYQYNLDPNNRYIETHPSVGPQERIASQVDGGALLADVGTVTRIVNPTNGNLIVLFNGNYGAGLLGAILSTTRKANFHVAGFSQSSPAQQLLIRVPSILGNIIDRDHTVQAIRNWISFQAGEASIKAAIEDKRQPNQALQPSAQREP